MRVWQGGAACVHRMRVLQVLVELETVVAVADSCYGLQGQHCMFLAACGVESGGNAWARVQVRCVV